MIMKFKIRFIISFLKIKLMKKIFIDNFDPIKSNELFGHSTLFNNLATFYENRKVPKVIMYIR